MCIRDSYVDSVQSITVDYNGAGDYFVSTKNLAGILDETAHFHYEGVAEVATTSVVTATSTPVPAPVLAEVAGNKYIVQSGDYLYKIAVLHNTSVQALVLANNIANSDLVFEGQVLILP